MNKLFWLIPLILFGFQTILTISSTHQIRNEEAVASIREVWWFTNHQLYHPNNSNIGWYGVLSLIYSIFGFDIFAGKIYRLILSLISLYCLAAILKKYLGGKWAVLPFLTIGLSPTLLFFNTIANPYGIDLQFLPIVLFLLMSQIGLIRLMGIALAMFAWVSYPTFAFYLPALFFLHLRGGVTSSHPGGVLAGLGAFLAPLLAFIIYFKGWPGHIFFAGGSFAVNEDIFFRTIGSVFTNLFSRADAYYLEISQVEFSLIFPIISILFIFYCVFGEFKKLKPARVFIILCLLTAFFNLVITGITVDGGMPGGRRNTPVLAVFYVLFVLAWHHITSTKYKVQSTKWAGIVILAVLLVHHLVVFPLNLESVKSSSFFKINNWFGNSDPGLGLQHYLGEIRQKDVYFNCEETYKGDPQCQYGIIYAALAESCLKSSCHQMYGYFPGAAYQPLSIEAINYWQEQDFEH